MREDEQLAIPSDITTLHRTPTELTDDGDLRAIEIRGDKHTMVLAYHRDGGLAVLGGVTMREVLRPSAGEAGARKMVEIYRVIEGLDIRGIDDTTAEAIDRLHAAVIEYRDFVENIRPDLPETERMLQSLQDKLGGISAAALRALQNTEEQPDDRQVVEHVRRLISALQVWQQGAANLLAQGVLTAGGKPALVAPGALREIITSGDPLPFWSGLRETLAELRARAEAGDRKSGASAALVQENELARLRVADLMHAPATATVGKSLSELLAELAEMHRDDAGASAQVREIRQVLEEFQGRTPDPARSTVQIAREVVSQAERWRNDIARLEGEGIHDDEGDASLAGQLRELANNLEAGASVEILRDSITRSLRRAASRVQPETEAEFRERVAAAAIGRASFDSFKATVRQAIDNVSRIVSPGAGILRVVLAADVREDDIAAAEALVKPIAPLGTRLIVEREPGKAPEGYVVEIDGEFGEAVGGGESWGWTLGEGDDGGAAFESEADAVDDAWNAYAEGSLSQDKADA